MTVDNLASITECQTQLLTLPSTFTKANLSNNFAWQSHLQSRDGEHSTKQAGNLTYTVPISSKKLIELEHPFKVPLFENFSGKAT